MQVVMITGSARRIGAAIAEACHESGANVVLHAHQSVGEAEQLAATFNQQRPNSAIVLQADLREAQVARTLVDAAVAHWGQLDALINNASIFYPTPVANATEQDAEAFFSLHCMAPFFLAQAAHAALKATAGSIVNITDVHGLKPLKQHSLYSMSKAALVMMTKSLAIEFAPDVRVNAIAPGNILWPEGENNHLTEKAKTAILQQNRLQRQGRVDEIAAAVLFLLFNATFTTGHVLPVDGCRD